MITGCVSNPLFQLACMNWVYTLANMKKSILYDNQYWISYTENGDKNGPPILIDHGLIASVDNADLFHSLIQAGAHLISIARPGYGESSPYVLRAIGDWADLVSAVINELQLSQFDILGVSSGAPYSYAVGYKFPEQLRNIYIFSGIPALYDQEVQSCWPFPITKDASIEEMELLTHDLFFSNLSVKDLERNDIKDSMKNHGFGIAQDLILRSNDWGFDLSEIHQNVYMQHSRGDPNIPLITAQLTAKMLPHHELTIKESDEHFSPRALDEFIKLFIVRNLESEKRISFR